MEETLYQTYRREERKRDRKWLTAFGFYGFIVGCGLCIGYALLGCASVQEPVQLRTVWATLEAVQPVYRLGELKSQYFIYHGQDRVLYCIEKSASDSGIIGSLQLLNIRK